MNSNKSPAFGKGREGEGQICPTPPHSFCKAQTTEAFMVFPPEGEALPLTSRNTRSSIAVGPHEKRASDHIFSWTLPL